MKNLASLAVLLTLAVSYSANAEDTPQQIQAKKQAARHNATHGTTTFQKSQFSNRNVNARVHAGVYNPNIQAQTNRHVTTVNRNWNKQIQNAATTKTVTTNANWKNNPNWKNNRNWKNNPNWKNNRNGQGNVNWRSKNWWQSNPQWQANHAKWANYHRWERNRHDRIWWTSHYDRFAVFGGGYYYWNNGFWYPAYGYDPTFDTYSYNAPIYAYNDQEPGQVVADVQNALRQAGYDPGPIDNAYGPQTRDALIRYQEDTGLQPTGEIDEPTLASLGLE